MDRYVDRSTALDVNIEGVAPDPGMAIRTGDLNGPTISLLPQENLGNYTFGPGELDQLARVDPVFAKRTADVVGGLDEVIAKWERDRPRIEAFNAEKGRTVIDVEQEIANAHRLQRGLIDGLRKKVSDGEAITSDTQAWIETRLSDMEIRLEKLKSGEVDPTSMLRRNFFALKEKHRTGGVAPTKPVMSAVKNIQARVEELASLEQEIRALVAGKTPQGAIRAVRKMLGESRFASSRELLSKLADDPAALVDQLVRDNPEGGMLKQVLDMTPRESSHILGVRQGVVSKTERGKVYSGLEGVSPDAATPIARKVKPTTKATTSGTGVAASLASELRDAIGGDANYNLIFGEAKSAAEIRAQLRAIVEDPIGMQRKILTGVDNSPSAEILSDSLHAAGHQDPTYYPYISEERQTKSVFFPNRSAKGANIKARDPSEQRLVGSLLREGDYIRDPVEAMTQRAARVAKTENTWRSMSHRIKSTGRIVTDAESVPEGWVAVSPDALFFNHRTRMDFLNHVEDLRLAGVAPEQAFKQALEAVTIKAQDDIESLLGHAAGEGKPAIYAIPRVVYDEMGAAADWGKVAGKPWVRSGWDPMMNAWRGLVLSGSPRWIVNNVLGNTVFAAMQGVKVADVVRILTERLRGMAAGWAAKHGDLGGALSDLIGGKDLRPNSLAARAMKDLPGGSSVGSGFFNSFSENYRQHLGEAATTPMGKIVEKSRTVGNKSMVLPHKIATFMRNLNSEIEASYREASFLTAIEKQAGKTAIQRTGRSFWGANKRITDIMENGFDEAKAKLALDEVNHFMGDYTTMGPFERHVVRRFVFPFWGFYRHATKLIVSFPFEYPLRAQVMMGLANVTKDLMDQYGPMPQWLQGAIPMSPPGAEVSFLRTAGANPFQGVTQDWTSMLSPPLKMMLERAQGKQSFTGNKFTDENTFTPFGSDQSYDLRTLQPTEGNVLPSIMEQLAQQVPQYTMLKDLVAGGSSYDTASLGDILGGHGVIRDPTTGAPRYPVGAGELLAKFLGAPVSNIDLGAFQARQTSDQKQALAEAIRRLQALGVHP